MVFVQRYFTRLILYVLFFMCPISFYNEPSKERKRALRKLLVFFGEVEPINLSTVEWNMRYDRNISRTACWFPPVTSSPRDFCRRRQTATQNWWISSMNNACTDSMRNSSSLIISKNFRKSNPVHHHQVAWQLDDDVRDSIVLLRIILKLRATDPFSHAILAHHHYSVANISCTPLR